MNTAKKLFWVTVFSIAMGFLESAVVIYLRDLYYPNGFVFPLVPMAHDVIIVEIWREAATIVMLLAVGMLAGRTKAERFAWFIYSFAVWDIVYYLFLFVCIGWPQSLLTWDILFLIPVPWVGPVIAPVIIAATLIMYAMVIVYASGKTEDTHLKTTERLLLLAGCLLAIIAFTEDYWRQKGGILSRNAKSGGSMFTDLASYVPARFDWPLFLAGEAIILAAWFLYLRRMRNPVI